MAEKSTETIRHEFLDYIWNSIARLSKSEKYKEYSETKKLEMLAFDILSVLDGAAMSLPAFIVAPDPHPDDKAFLVQNNEDHYPENAEANISGNISGELHDEFYTRQPKDPAE